jgi:tetratricopeptide (TPR) repeat protein
MVSLVRVALVAALTLAPIAAFPDAPNSREEALAALRSPDAAARAEGVVWIARSGTAADAGPLYERLRDESALVRGFAEQALWLVWGRSGDAAVDRLMERGTDEMQAGRHREAIATFSEVIRRKPDFAEGWNKRATVLYLAGQFRRSLADCDEVLKRNPRHFGALSGAGLNHLELEQHVQALAWFRRALAVNPNMTAILMEVQRLEKQLRERST